ncbi:MAG: acylneuraminate cytidylyltransferase family protein [Muribaculaceae bacterium]|nr:acylneuraminate cytidylyltransferase family protein [Muribaculaceae bacterium]
MKALVIIPARGGSKGIPRKNIKSICGKPLIGYTIEVAKEIANVVDICVSTDDAEIATIAESFGIPVPFIRPDVLSSDTAGSREVMLHAIDFYKEQGKLYDTIILLQPTSPFRNADDVRACIALYSADIDMVVSVKVAASNPYYNCFECDEDGLLHISKGEGLFTRRQDAPKTWEYNGAVYIINVDSLRKMPLGAFPKRIMYEMPAERSLDIDTPIDLKIAEAVMSGNI